MGEIDIKDRAGAAPAEMRSADLPTMEQPLVAPRSPVPPDQALQVLAMAEQAAADRVAAALREADRIREAAHAAAAQVARDAEAHAEQVRREADLTLATARATVQEADDDARRRADEARQRAGKILAEARARSGGIAADAQRHAERLELKAQQRYEASVGTLRDRREALERRIQVLERFDSECRARLTVFIEGQLHALSAPTTPGGPTVENRRNTASAGSAWLE